MRLTVRSPAVATLTLKLAESLNVYGIVGDNGLGRLLALRVRGQNSVLVNLPRTLVRGTTVTLTIAYGGRLAGANPDREAVGVQQDTAIHEEFALTAEPRLVYSNRSYWYPQAPVTDYATGVLRLTVPDRRACVASGTPATGNPVRVTTARGSSLRYVFLVNQPARYFSTVVSRLGLASDTEVTTPTPVSVAVQANPRQMGRGRALSSQAAAILGVYGEVLGDYPYRTLTLAAVDDALPGGHSPAYFALVNQPLPATKFTWANDPVAFEGYPQFFLAHEIAHQFWGGAVGWESYHEQWISEGFAQYFALLYAERSLDADRVQDIRRKLRTTATGYADQGPIWLGYRLGHLQEDGRVFRALVYNKSAHGAAHAAALGRRRRLLRRPARALRAVALHQDRDTPRAARLRIGVGARSDPLLRSVDPQRRDAAAAGRLRGHRRLGVGPDRPARTRDGRAGDGVGRLRHRRDRGSPGQALERFNVRAAAGLGAGARDRTEPRRSGAHRRRTRHGAADPRRRSRQQQPGAAAAEALAGLTATRRTTGYRSR